MDISNQISLAGYEVVRRSNFQALGMLKVGLALSDPSVAGMPCLSFHTLLLFHPRWSNHIIIFDDFMG